jgi:sarcosine oxidase
VSPSSSRPSANSTGQNYRYVVVGAGLLGLSAAWSLSRRGHQVLVLDTDVPGHAGAGSKGTARIFRLSYPDPLYVEMAAQARALWRLLEAHSGRALLQMTTLANFGQDLEAIAAAMTQAGTPFCRLTESETDQRFGGHLRINGPALLEEGSGVLAADACLQALVEAGSFELRIGPPVVALDDQDDHVSIALADGQRLTTQVVINCAGPDSLALLPDVVAPIAAGPSLQQVVYLRPEHPDADIPLFIEWGDDTVYGLPVTGQRLLKLSHHMAGPPVAPDAMTSDDDPHLVDQLLAAAARLLPTFNRTPVATERCLYDNTLDSDFLIERVGQIVIGCGTSGHGFKFGPLLGEIMADLATDVAPTVPLERFALARSSRPRRPPNT